MTCVHIQAQTERDRAERDSLSDADVVVVCDEVVPPNECPLSCGAPCPAPPRYSLAGLSVAPDELTVRPGLEARLLAAAAAFGCAAARWCWWWCRLAFWRHERASTLARILALVDWPAPAPVPAVVENEDESAKGRGATAAAPAGGAAAAAGGDDEDDAAVVLAGGLYLVLAI